MTEPAEPAPISPAAEFEFEWEVAPLGQRETRRLTYSGQVVRFPSSEILRVVTGPSIGKHEDYWDPTGSGNPLLDTGPAHKDKKLSTSFTVRELTTSGGVSADIARIDPKLVECLQRLRDHVGKGVKITSGFRSWKRNRDIYEKRGKPPTLSQHCAGRGADIHIAGMNGLEIGKAAIDACGPKIGVGLGNTFAHIDVRGLAAAWNYGGVKDSWVAEIKRYQKGKGSSSRKPSTAGTQPRSDGAKGPPQYSLSVWAESKLPAAMNGKLYWFDSKNGGSTTAVYVPNAALATDPLCLLVWIHGDLICGDEGADAVALVNSKQFPLAKQVTDSRLPFVLAAPSMKWQKGQNSHTLGSPRTMNAFLEEVRTGLVVAGWSSAPSFGRLILAGHSRAYAVLNGLARGVSDAESSKGALATLTDVRLLDTTYGKMHKQAHCANWMKWAKAKSGVNLRIFYRRNSDTAAVAECIRDGAAAAGLTNVAVKDFHPKVLSHCDMPRDRMPNLLAVAGNWPVHSNGHRTPRPMPSVS